MNVAANDMVPLRVRTAIRDHLKARRTTLPVSVAKLMRLARKEAEGLVLSDEVLSSFIAKEAVSVGRSVHFDNKFPWPQFPLDLSSDKNWL